jgi:hypothetical protein
VGFYVFLSWFNMTGELKEEIKSRLKINMDKTISV